MLYVVIDVQNLFDQPVKKYLRTCNNIRKCVSGPGYNYTNNCLLDYLYFKVFYKTIVVDLCKQKVLVSKLFLLEIWNKMRNVFHY